MNPSSYDSSEKVDPNQVCNAASNPTYWPMKSWNVFSQSEEYEVRYQDQVDAKKKLGVSDSTGVNEYNIDN